MRNSSFPRTAAIVLTAAALVTLPLAAPAHATVPLPEPIELQVEEEPIQGRTFDGARARLEADD